MSEVDLKKELKHLYNPSAREISLVDVPPMSFLMVGGAGDPNVFKGAYAGMRNERTPNISLQGRRWLLRLPDALRAAVRLFQREVFGDGEGTVPATRSRL